VRTLVLPEGVLRPEHDGRGLEDVCCLGERDEVGDYEEVDSRVPGIAIKLQHTADVGEGAGQVKVHLERDAHDAAGAWQGRHGEGDVATLYVVVKTESKGLLVGL
jgi:hypothetical protein